MGICRNNSWVSTIIFMFCLCATIATNTPFVAGYDTIHDPRLSRLEWLDHNDMFGSNVIQTFSGDAGTSVEIPKNDGKVGINTLEIDYDNDMFLMNGEPFR